jgi:hypothetical protein
VEIPVFNGDLNGKEFIECLSIGERVFDMKYAPIYDTDFDDEDLVEVSSLSYGQETDKKKRKWDTYQVFDKIPYLENNMQLNIVGQYLPTLFNKTPQRVDSFSISLHIVMFSTSKRKT